MAGIAVVLAGLLAALDPTVAKAVALDEVVWVPGEAADVALISGDSSKPGLYVQLVRWHPNHMSRPHFHTNVRVITVLKGTWWVGVGPRYDPASTTPMGAGTVVTHFAQGVHYDGAKDEEAIVQIVGEGPVITTAAEAKP